MISAGIVTFEPDLARLRENLSAIRPQVERVFIFDNGSNNVEDVLRLARTFDMVEVVTSRTNRGIAHALNALAERARIVDSAWIVTLDQDSVAEEGMVGELRRVADNNPNAALIAPVIIDRNKPEAARHLRAETTPTSVYSQAARRGAITSGALTNIETIRKIGGFDDELFIDYVDYDLNQRLLISGYQIIRANRAHLLHEVGRARKTWLQIPRKDVAGEWRLERFYSFNHSSARCYYKARNRVIFTRKYWRKIGVSHEGIFQIPQQVLLTILFEPDKRAKAGAFWRGFVDGIRADVVPWDGSAAR